MTNNASFEKEGPCCYRDTPVSFLQDTNVKSTPSSEKISLLFESIENSVKRYYVKLPKPKLRANVNQRTRMMLAKLAHGWFMLNFVPVTTKEKK